MAEIGFVGTGNIGNPMARRMAEAGHDLVVFDLRPAATANLIELGAAKAKDAREVAERCRVVFTSLPGPANVEEALRGDAGLLAGAQAGDVVADLTTNSVSAVKRMAAVAAAAGVTYLDTPVTGGVRGADRGTLTVLGSGDEAAFERVRPLFDAFAANVFYLGETGTGTLVKLINNVIALCSSQVTQEAFVLGTKAGLDPAQLYDVLRTGTSKPFLGIVPTVAGRKFEEPSFTLGLAAKDIGLALETARDMAVPMPVSAAAHQTYLRAVAAGLSDLSFAATFLVAEEAAGVKMAEVEIAREG